MRIFYLIAIKSNCYLLFTNKWFEREKVLDMIIQPTLKDRARDMLEFDGKVIYRAYSKNPYVIYVECTI